MKRQCQTLTSFLLSSRVRVLTINSSGDVHFCFISYFLSINEGLIYSMIDFNSIFYNFSPSLSFLTSILLLLLQSMQHILLFVAFLLFLGLYVLEFFCSSLIVTIFIFSRFIFIPSGVSFQILL